ncbi:E3 ubiquitin-protein ligase TRIM39-like isoform X2 [Pleurodeles waltl]|uniref:E3 ubiquitin-protein ligase TRIM39-like isoform X2 n=1 Tax=Pleurodeles waltl TaxID=8319 RepID=UPI0037096FF2
MAANKQLREEATCSICLEYFTDPVAAECGHAFCLSCITRCWEGLETDFPCPQCRETSKNKILRPIRQLGNIVELLKQLQTLSAAPQGENLCREHEEKLKLFCEEDQVPICVICRESREHKAHSVLPIPEAALGYKKSLHDHVERLKKELKDLQTWTAEGSRTAEELEEIFKNQTKKILNTFELLKQFLEKEEKQLLSELEEEHEEKMTKIREKLSKLEKLQSTHQDMITEVEGKCQQQDVELLKDVQIILGRCDQMKAEKPQEEAAVEQTLQSRKHASLEDKLLELKAIPVELEWRYMKTYATAVTLDPDTAHRRLILSEDGRSVRHRDRAQDLPDTPQRFNPVINVLGRERLSSGRHYWEVEVGDKTGWDLGVCDEAVSRKGGITASPENGYWAVLLRDGEYKALTSRPTLLTPRAPPRAVGLFLDYEAGRLSLYNVDDRSLLFTFCGASFPPTLRPFFSPHLREGWRNAGALRILPVTGQE